MTLTVEQQKAIAIATARKRMADAQSQNTASGSQPSVNPVSPAIPEATTSNDTTMSTGMGELRNMAQGATLGNTDRIASGILKAVLPEKYADQIDQIRENKASDLAKWNQDNKIDSFISGALGAASSLGAAGETLSAGAQAIAPEATSALSNMAAQFAAAHPYLASSVIGGTTGAVYGGASAPPGETTNGAIAGGVTGAVASPIISAIGRKVISPLVSKGKSALQDFLATSEGEPAAAAAMAPAAPPMTAFSDITNQPLGAAAMPEAKGAFSLTGKLPLSPGVRTKDANLLRVEENAKQGLMGADAQTQMQGSTDAVYQGARNAMQQLKGLTNKDSDQLLSDSVSKFQERANQVKSTAQALYKQRDDMMADAVLNKSKVAPSLGADLSDVVNDSSNIAGFKSKSGSPALQLYKQFKSMVSGGKNKELPFSDLAAWRQDVASLATTDQSTAGVMAGRLGRAYDQWMDNIDQSHFISGNPNIAAKAKEASSAWKGYKTLFGSENSPVIAGMTKPYDATPADFVDKVFGATVKGNGNTALNMRKMTAALPPEAQQQFKDNVFSGLISRAFEKANNADQLSLANLRNNLSSLKDSQVYRETYAGDKSKDVVITNLIKDLTQHITQTGRRDVVSPSGGAILRGVGNLLSKTANTPLIGSVPGVKAADAIVNKMGEYTQNSVDRETFNSSMKAAAKQAHENARSAPVFDFNALKSGVLGGISSGAMVQTTKKEKRK